MKGWLESGHLAAWPVERAGEGALEAWGLGGQALGCCGSAGADGHQLCLWGVFLRSNLAVCPDSFGR